MMTNNPAAFAAWASAVMSAIDLAYPVDRPLL